MTLLELSAPGLPNILIGDPFGSTNQLYTTTFSAAANFTSDEATCPAWIVEAVFCSENRADAAAPVSPSCIEFGQAVLDDAD